jgi:hypothetical protein
VQVAPAVAALTFVALVTAATAAASSRDTQTIAVTLTASTATFAPTFATPGNVVFRVLNKDHGSRSFTVAGKTAPSIAPGKTVTFSLVLRSLGFVPYTSGGKGRTRLAGLLSVQQPCTNPTSTTLNVQMAQDHGAITVSQSTVPCGTVTFVVTNVGALVDSLNVFSTSSGVKGATPELSPGQTALLTLTFPTKGTVHYESGDYPPAEPEYGGDFGEEGMITLA